MSTQASNNNCKLQNSPPVFKKGDIVWAKVRGYSWWPAKVWFIYTRLGGS